MVDPYELSLIETTDDLELFVFWRECRLVNENIWARLLPPDLAVRLFDAGIRSVAAVAALVDDNERLVAITHVAEYRMALLAAARAWPPLPDGWRREVAGIYGLRLAPVPATRSDSAVSYGAIDGGDSV